MYFPCLCNLLICKLTLLAISWHASERNFPYSFAHNSQTNFVFSTPHTKTKTETKCPIFLPVSIAATVLSEYERRRRGGRKEGEKGEVGFIYGWRVTWVVWWVGGVEVEWGEWWGGCGEVVTVVTAVLLWCLWFCGVAVVMCYCATHKVALNYYTLDIATVTLSVTLRYCLCHATLSVLSLLLLSFLLSRAVEAALPHHYEGYPYMTLQFDRVDWVENGRLYAERACLSLLISTEKKVPMTVFWFFKSVQTVLGIWSTFSSVEWAHILYYRLWHSYCLLSHSIKLSSIDLSFNWKFGVLSHYPSIVFG